MTLGRRVKLATAISFVVMLLVNYGANAFRLNGMTTADVSGIYQTPLTPAGYTFAIWGLIYTLLLLHVLFACGLFKAEQPSLTADDAGRIERAFVISSLANCAWILAWQYLLIPLSLVLIVVIFACLITIAIVLRRAVLSAREVLLMGVPFGVYLGWITVAVLQNVCVLLASLGAWTAEGSLPDILAMLILVVGLVVVAVLVWLNREVSYPLVAIWAYVGILVRYASSPSLMNSHAAIAVTLGACIVVFVAMTVMVFSKRMRSKGKSEE